MNDELAKIRRRKITFIIVVAVFVIGLIIWAILYNLFKPESATDQDYARQRQAAQSADQANQQFHSTFDIVNMLPAEGDDYMITYEASPDKPGQYAVVINDYGIQGGKQDALNAITAAGYNPSKYEIIYESDPPTVDNP